MKKPRSKKWNCSKKPRSTIRTSPWRIARSRKRSSMLDNFELAKKAAETALRLRPDLAEGHLALARYYWLAPDANWC